MRLYLHHPDRIACRMCSFGVRFRPAFIGLFLWTAWMMIHAEGVYAQTSTPQAVVADTTAKAVVQISVGQDNEVELYADGKLLGRGDWRGKLTLGKHELEARKDRHNSAHATIDVKPDVTMTFVMPHPTPIYGELKVMTKPAGATVLSDGKVLGKTPFSSKSVLVGDYRLKIELPGHKTETAEVTVREGQVSEVEKTLNEYCTAVLNAQAGAKIYMDGKILGETPYKFDQKAGVHSLRIVHEGYAPYVMRHVRLDGDTKDMEIRLRPYLLNHHEIYAQVGYNVSGCSGVSIGVGGYLRDVNLQVNCVFSSVESGTIYWRDPNNEWQKPVATTYKPSCCFAFKAGYGFRFGTRLRLTPQLGLHTVSLQETSDSEQVVASASMMSFTLGARVFFAFTKHVGVSFTPEYMHALGLSEACQAITDRSSDIKALGEGIHANISLNLFF